ncbi:MAG TPA: GntR family transcriptional regulator [Geminicoccaceae bacterium]|nr:GntR family transcriptional regulator [Geminicoccaceae bacterium]
MERLRAMIVDGRLQPGERVAEVELCTAFRVSRTPLREALKVLAAEGLVELLPNRGARVVRLTTETLAALFELMSVLEGFAGELAAQRITEAELDMIRALHKRLLAAYRARDRHAYFQVNQAIHDAILAAAASEPLRIVHRGVAAQILASRYKANLSPRRWAESIAEHELILRLLALRRPVELSHLLRAHIMNKLEVVRESLAASASEPALPPTRRTTG